MNNLFLILFVQLAGIKHAYVELFRQPDYVPCYRTIPIVWGIRTRKDSQTSGEITLISALSHALRIVIVVLSYFLFKFD